MATAVLFGCGDSEPGSLEPEVVRLNGTVRRVDAEVLLPDVDVRASGLSARTTPKGSYSIEGLGVGEAEVTVEHPGYEPYFRRVRIRAGTNGHDILLIPVS